MAGMSPEERARYEAYIKSLPAGGTSSEGDIQDVVDPFASNPYRDPPAKVLAAKVDPQALNNPPAAIPIKRGGEVQGPLGQLPPEVYKILPDPVQRAAESGMGIWAPAEGAITEEDRRKVRRDEMQQMLDAGSGWDMPPPAEQTQARAMQAQNAEGLKAEYVGGGWSSRLSPGALSEFEAGFGLSGHATSGELENAQRMAKENELLRIHARDEEAAKMSELTGRAEGQYFASMNELQRAQRIKEESDHEAEDAMRQVRESGIDPNKFFKEQGTFGNIMLALNVAMGQFFSAYTGQNNAQKIIDDAIARDIRAQEVNLKNKQVAADFTLAKNLHKTQDLDKARELTRLQMLELTKLQMSKMAQDNQSSIEQRNFNSLMSGLDTAMERSMASLTLAHAQFRASHEIHTPAQLRVGGYNFSALLGSSAKDAERYIPGLGLAPDAETKRKIAEKVEPLAAEYRAFADLADAARKASAVHRLGGKLNIKTKEWRELEAAAAKALVFMAKTDVNATSLRPNQAEEFREMLGNPTALLQNSDTSVAIAQKLADGVRGRMQIAAGAENFIPAQRINVTDPNTGRVTQVYITGEAPEQDVLQTMPSGTKKLNPMTR